MNTTSVFRFIILGVSLWTACRSLAFAFTELRDEPVKIGYETQFFVSRFPCRAANDLDLCSSRIFWPLRRTGHSL